MKTSVFSPKIGFYLSMYRLLYICSLICEQNNDSMYLINMLSIKLTTCSLYNGCPLDVISRKSFVNVGPT